MLRRPDRVLDAIEAVWPQVKICLVRLIRNTIRFISWKTAQRSPPPSNHVSGTHRSGGGLGLNDFEAEWGDQHPAVVELWRRNWERFTPFLEFDPAIRKIIYTTNAVESLNYQLRKVTKTRGHFPTDDAVLKILYLASPTSATTEEVNSVPEPKGGNEHSTRSPPSPDASQPPMKHHFTQRT
ncbi:MAG TPA: transposase [Acidimicrobiia bacterium]|nr:transposase [Acidimicrobiia bacterium]